MLVYIKDKDLIETESYTSLEYEDKNGTFKTFKFKGLSGFNKDIVEPLFKTFCSNKSCVSHYTVTVASTHKTKEVFIINNCKETTSIFNTFKRLGISLQQLRIYYSHTTDHVTLEIKNNIVRAMSGYNDSFKENLTAFIYTIVSVLLSVYKNINTISPHITENNRMYLNLEECYTTYNKMFNEDSTLVEIVGYDESEEFINVVIHNNAESNVKNPYAGMMGVSDYYYNILEYINKDDDTPMRTILLINKSASPNLYYILNLRSGFIFTNSSLFEFNTFNKSELMPILCSACIDYNYEINEFEMQNAAIFKFTLENLFSSPLLGANTCKKITVSSELTEAEEKIIEKISNISENTDLKSLKEILKDFEVCTNTDFKNLEEEYTDEESKRLRDAIPEYIDKVDLKDLTGIVKGVALGNVYAMLFVGESGTGKTTAAKAISNKTGIPIVLQNASVNIEESDFIGTYESNKNRESEKDPPFIWKDGVLTNAVRKGYIYGLEEITFARPGVLGMLNSLLDESRQLTLPTGEIVKAHPNFRLFATGNIAYEGTNRLNKALVQRFDIVKEFKDLEGKECWDIVQSRCNYHDKAKYNKIWSVYTAIKKFSDEKKINLVVSVRDLMDVFNTGKYFKTAYDAVMNCMVSKAFIQNKDQKEFFIETVLKAMESDLAFKI